MIAAALLDAARLLVGFGIGYTTARTATPTPPRPTRQHPKENSHE